MRLTNRPATYGFRDSNSPSRIASRREQEVILASALARLPAHYSEVIVLRRFSRSKSFAEVAEIMGRTVPSVKSIWTRAMTRLREEFRSGNLMDASKPSLVGRSDAFRVASDEPRLTKAMEEVSCQFGGLPSAGPRRVFQTLRRFAANAVGGDREYRLSQRLLAQAAQA